MAKVMVYLESTFSIAPLALLKHNHLKNIFVAATRLFNQQVMGMYLSEWIKSL